MRHTRGVALAIPSVEPVGEMLQSLRMSGALYCQSELSTPWGLSLPSMPDCLMFHIVVAGRCRIRIEGIDDRVLEPGDLVVVPHGQGHALSSGPGVSAARLFDLQRDRLSERYELLRHGGGGELTSLLCGVVRVGHEAARRLVNQLPPVITVQASASPSQWMLDTVRLLCTEARELRPGGETIITRLGDVVVIHAIRSWIEAEPSARTGWLGALRDQQIGRALSAIHRHPHRRWTIASLAATAAMSRSAFAARFTRLLSEAPMAYVARSRMHAALARLEEDDAPPAAIAGEFGYRSEAAFFRAFKRVTGQTPGQARRAAARNRPPGSALTP
jgi:AraC-like DNA-binding protein/mannose-6-phosphate isomerase-like protein (cupin superfamily)